MARRCRPCSSKFSSSNQRCIRRLICGHSESSMATQAGSRLRPFTPPPENAFETEAQSLSSTTRGLVQHVALPFVAAVAQGFKHILRQQKLRFGGNAAAFKPLGINHPAHVFKNSENGLYTQYFSYQHPIKINQHNDNKYKNITNTFAYILHTNPTTSR